MVRITNEQLIAEHLANRAAGGTMDTLATKTQMKKGTLSSRLNGLRKELRDQGMTDEAVDHVLPLYGYKKGPKGDKAVVLSQLAKRATEFMVSEANKKAATPDKTEKTEKTA